MNRRQKKKVFKRNHPKRYLVDLAIESLVSKYDLENVFSPIHPATLVKAGIDIPQSVVSRIGGVNLNYKVFDYKTFNGQKVSFIVSDKALEGEVKLIPNTIAFRPYRYSPFVPPEIKIPDSTTDDNVDD